MTYEDDLSTLYLWTAADDICQMTLDLSTATEDTYNVNINDCP